jgi:hypothetical protein
MTILSANRLIIAAEMVIVCAITYGALEVARHFFGRAGFWLLGLAALFLAGFLLFRLRK